MDGKAHAVQSVLPEPSDKFEASEEVGDFEGGGFRGVGAVCAIVADAGAEVVADGAGGGLLGIGGAHGVAPFGDGAFGFKDKGEDFAGAHEIAELSEKGAGFMNGVKARGFTTRKNHRFDCNDAETSFMNAREYFSLKIAANGVRLDDCESAFECHREFLRVITASFTAKGPLGNLGLAKKNRTD
jgi:hypothetical protein